MSATVELFKVIVAQRTPINLSNLKHGFVTDFTPTQGQLKLLKSKFKPVDVVTLFSVQERLNSTPEQLLEKQWLHYIEVYGLGMPGLFNLEVSKGKIAPITYIRAVTLEELCGQVDTLLYANRPISDVSLVVDVIREHNIPYSINDILNNELRVVLFDPLKDKFNSGDDAVRWICWKATDSAMLIKSKRVIAAVADKSASDDFLERHAVPLAQVFNRHQRLIMACKNPDTRSTINRISRLSKTQHIPIHAPVSKQFISASLKGIAGALAALAPEGPITLRDKFKYLNLIEYKLLGLPYDTFLIRNGKVWAEANRPVLDSYKLKDIREQVLASIANDLAPLLKQSILLDPFVDYGLPISRKQTLGNLPYGTRVRVPKDKPLSAGIYWHNDFADDPKAGECYSKSIDLDLSAIDDKGARTGWGGYAGYSNKGPIVFSGDLTDASQGATEYMVVDPAAPNKYGLMVNIFRGPEPCPVDIVVGYPTERKWAKETFIRERIILQAKQSIIGFLKDDSFVIYGGQLNNSRVSGGFQSVIAKALGKLWTLKDILNASGVNYHTVPELPEYTHDLRYSGFTIDKLESLLGT